METAKMGQDAAGREGITFFVAECKELLKYGEYVKEMTVKEYPKVWKVNCAFHCRRLVSDAKEKIAGSVNNTMGLGNIL